jgi:broad specificity phosphatase PhoE
LTAGPRRRPPGAAAGRRPAPAPPAAAAPTRFGRTRRTAEIALGGRALPYVEAPLFDDVDIGELDGALTADYRAWKRAHTRRDRFPGGESLVEAAERYAAGFERLAESPHASVFLVGHDIPLRSVLNAAGGSPWLDGPIHDVPHGTAFLFDEAALRRATRRIRELAAVEA